MRTDHMMVCMLKQEIHSNERSKNGLVRRKVKICFLPTSKEDDTTNLGCDVVFLEILENAGLVEISRKTIVVGVMTMRS